MSKGKKIVYNKAGWRIEQILSWPESAKLHHQGWCTSTCKDDFDEYIDDGDLYVIYKPTNRNNRPSYQVFIADDNRYGKLLICGSGDREISPKQFLSDVPIDCALISEIRSICRNDAIRKQQEHDSERLYDKCKLRHVGRINYVSRNQFELLFNSFDFSPIKICETARFESSRCQNLPELGSRRDDGSVLIEITRYHESGISTTELRYSNGDVEICHT